MARYRLLAGMHIAADKSKPKKGTDGKPTGRFEQKVYRKGDVVESDLDLVALHGAKHFELVGGEVARAADRVRELEAEVARLRAEKGLTTGAAPHSANFSPAVMPGGQVTSGFQGLDAGEVPKAPHAEREGDKGADDDLEALTVAQLKERAAREEIDLSGLHTKAEIVKAVKAARKG